MDIHIYFYSIKNIQLKIKNIQLKILKVSVFKSTL